MSGAPPARGLAFKAREIEELADVWFFRPVGLIVALGARSLALTPTAVTLIGTGVGVAGGALLAWPERAFIGFLLLILHGVFDSSDGQLARMTGQSSEFGRMIDGVGGYVTHVAIYAGLIASALRGGGTGSVVLLGLGAGLCNILHAQLYDYHRTTYIAIAVEGKPTGAMVGRPARGLVGRYEAMQRLVAGLHPDVEEAVADRAVAGRVSDDDRVRYRRCFYWPVRGWNLLGDNTRFYAIGLLAWLGRADAFFLFVLLPMNAAGALLWTWQRAADRRFLSAV